MQDPPKTMGCLGGLAHGLKTICNDLLTMYNKAMGCIGGLADPDYV